MPDAPVTITHEIVTPALDRRRLLALIFLAAGALPSFAFAWHLATLTAHRSNGPWPIAYALYLALLLIFAIFSGFTFVLGRATINLSAGPVTLQSAGGSGDSAV